MILEIKTDKFNLNELQSIACYQYCISATENGDPIIIEIEDENIGEMIRCLDVEYNKYLLLITNNQPLVAVGNLVAAKIESFNRIVVMIRLILQSIADQLPKK